MLPLLGLAAVAIVSTVVASVASSSSSSSSSYTEDDFDERAKEAKEEALVERNKNNKKNIEQYKKRQVKRFADNYGVDIDFISKVDEIKNATVGGLIGGPFVGIGGYNKYIIKVISANDCEPNPIETLEEENKNLSQLIEQIKEMKNESLD